MLLEDVRRANFVTPLVDSVAFEEVEVAEFFAMVEDLHHVFGDAFGESLLLLL